SSPRRASRPRSRAARQSATLRTGAKGPAALTREPGLYYLRPEVALHTTFASRAAHDKYHDAPRQKQFIEAVTAWQHPAWPEGGPMDRREFTSALGAGLLAHHSGSLSGAEPASAGAATELSTFSAGELAQLIRARRASALEVLEAHLGRIEAHNPKLNA